MEILGNGFHWQKWMSLLLLTCAVLAYRTLDNPGYTRQFIARFDHDCRDFNGVLNKCHVWKDLGFCFKYRREMQHVCNKTCQYCVPGQKQWQIIDRVWGRVKDSAGQTVGVHDRDSAPVIQHKGGPSIQILGKERTPQVETASNAIATQLERGAHQDSQASPSVLGWLPKVRAGLQSTIAPARIKSETTNEETKEKLLTPQLTPPTTAVDQDQSGESINRQASISGKTQVRVSSKETDHRPVVVLMGYELGEKSSKKVHEVLKNSDSAEISESQSVNTSVPQRQHDYGLIALGRKNSNGTASTSTDNIASEYKDADSELEKVAEFLGNATTTGKRKHDKRPVHERKKILYVNASTLHSKLHAGSLNSPVTSASGNTTMEKAEKLKSQKEAILPISSDDIVNQQAIERVKSSASHTHHYKNNDMHEQQYQGIENGYLMPNSLGGMQAIDLSGTMMDAPLRKPKPPYYAGKQVTVTFNEKPKTEETFKQSPPPNNFHAKENEEDIDKSEEEKIRMATQSIKNVLKLFGNDYRDHHEKLKLVTQSAKDLPAHSKSLEIHRELAGIQREIDTQTQSQDRSAENAQAISRQIGQELTTNESGNRMTNVPNYAVISTKGSKDWKNLAHVLAIQLKGVLNHMENREKENQYEKDRMEEEMMMMAQQQDEDDDPDYDGDNYDDDDMNERRHSVLMPLATNSSKKAFKKFILENKRPQRLKYESSVDEKRLLHQDVKTLSKLEMLYKSQERNSSNHE